MMVSRGPQLVQLRKGYRYRRSPGSNNSARQSSQVATSGEMKISPAESASLGSIRKEASPRGGRLDQCTASIRARGGGWVVSSARKRASVGGAPSVSESTPPVQF